MNFKNFSNFKEASSAPLSDDNGQAIGLHQGPTGPPMSWTLTPLTLSMAAAIVTLPSNHFLRHQIRNSLASSPPLKAVPARFESKGFTKR
jgi:hypothetical protein